MSVLKLGDLNRGIIQRKKTLNFSFKNKFTAKKAKVFFNADGNYKFLQGQTNAR